MDDATREPGFTGLIVIGLLALLAVALFDVAAAYDRQTAGIVVMDTQECSRAGRPGLLQERIQAAREQR